MNRIRTAVDAPAVLWFAGGVLASAGAAAYHLGLGLVVAGAFAIVTSLLMARVSQ